jgi:hypothetical protein
MASASVVLTSDTSGSVTVTVPSGTAIGTTTLTLPTTGGTIQTSGAGFTTNGVAYATSTSALATGSSLVWTGTNLGVGVTSPVWGVDISNSTGAGFRYKSTTGSGTIVVDSTGTGAGGSGISCRKNGTGYALFGVSGWINGDTSTDVQIFGDGSSGIRFCVAGSTTPAGTFDSSGNLLVAKTSAGSSQIGVQLQANGSVLASQSASTNAGGDCYDLYSTGASAYRFYVGMGGTIYATSTTITNISDQRLKENIRDLDDGLATVMALKPRKFDWKEGKGADIKNARGFIAQEFETVFPDMIEEWKDPAPEGEEPYKAVNANLIPTLVKSIQELSTLITAQSATITSLTERITALEGK